MTIRANAFSCDITPKEQVHLAGFSGGRRLSTGVRDPLLASAVHIRGGTGGIIVISLDLLCLDPEFTRSIRRRIVQATGTREQNVFVGTTQNHSGPPASTPMYRFGDESFAEPSEEYLAFVEEQAVQAASESAVTSRPAALAAVRLDKPNTGVIAVKDTGTGRLCAFIVVGSVIPAQLGAVNTEVSSDFLHEARQRIARGVGGEPVVAYFVASSGEHRLNLDAAATGGPDAAAKAAEKLAQEVVSNVKALASADFTSKEDPSGKFSLVHGVRRKILPDIVEAGLMLESSRKSGARAEAAGSDRRMAKWSEMEAGFAMNFLVARQNGRLIEALEESDPAELQVMNIGKTKLLGLPWVIFPEFGQEIAERAGGDVLIAECTNGDMQGSIISSDPSKPGSHRLLSPLFEPEDGEALFEAAVSLVSTTPKSAQGLFLVL